VRRVSEEHRCGVSDGKVHFNAPWGDLLIGLSVMSVALLAGLWVLMFTLKVTGHIFVEVFLCAIFVGCVPFVVRGYEIEGQTLYILRLGWKTREPLAGLQSAVADSSLIEDSYRILGNGGLLSFTGLYSSPRLGKYRAYLNDERKVVVLTFPDRKIVISPGDPGRFVTAVSAMAGTTDRM